MMLTGVTDTGKTVIISLLTGVNDVLFIIINIEVKKQRARARARMCIMLIFTTVTPVSG